ncbi:hypothetical protein BDN72DRAFT_837952 [Pluteus cervinus]|uniref:Uncharacterized protein n=1 Tax=Pluteus cervinus TaxID=181527 RepID=A0ACD3B080_9AGAR|nr:hypothetical protein BDN72DRAFT_837952 [Pluteus cervinus]
MSPPSGDFSCTCASAKCYAQLTGADIASNTPEERSNINNEAVTQAIRAFSKDCFVLKNELYKTLNELQTFESRLNLDPALAKSFKECITEYGLLLKSAQSFASYAAGRTLNFYINIVVPAAKEGVSKEELTGIIQKLITSKPSPDVRNSRDHLGKLRKSLEKFTTQFDPAIGKTELSDLDLTAANVKVARCKAEIAEWVSSVS